MALHKEMVQVLRLPAENFSQMILCLNLIEGMLTRSVSLGDFSGIDSGTIAGYTGHIPNARDAFGNTYSKLRLE